MDKETKEILTEQGHLKELLGHQGWSIARRRIAEKILSLQNAFDIEDGDPQKMLVDLQARKIASKLIFEFLRELEGSKDVMQEQSPKLEKSHILNNEGY